MARKFQSGEKCRYKSIISQVAVNYKSEDVDVNEDVASLRDPSEADTRTYGAFELCKHRYLCFQLS